MTVELLTVGRKSKVGAVAGAVAACLKRDGTVTVRAIGAGAVNQAVKAVALGQVFVAREGLDLICVPALVPVELDDGKRTAISFSVELRQGRSEDHAPPGTPE